MGALSADGRIFARSDDDRRVEIWDATAHKRIHRVLPDDLSSPTTESAAPLVLSSDGNLVAWAVAGQLTLYGVGGREVIASLPAPTSGRVTSLAFSPDDKLLAAGYGNGIIILWDVQSLTTTHARAHP